MFQLVLWSFLLLCQFDPWLGLTVKIVLRSGLPKAWNIKGSHDCGHQSLNTTLRLSVLSLQSLAPFSHFPCSLSLGSNTWKFANKTLMSYYFHISIIRWGRNGYHFCLLLWFSSLLSPLYFSTKLWTFLHLLTRILPSTLNIFLALICLGINHRAQFWWLF